jgi:hypothetical protein
MSTLTPSAPAAATGTLHLTQILVSYEDAVRLLRIRDTYDWHQRVWQAFGGRDGKPRDFLIRVDRKEEAYRVLMLSRSVPAKPIRVNLSWRSNRRAVQNSFCDPGVARRTHAG